MSGTQETTRSVQVLIEGRVQGVYYRGWTQEQALGLGLSGWVRNRLDGVVEAIFSGPASQVGEMLRLCKEGPGDALVTTVDIIQEGATVGPSFEIKPTG